MQYKTPVAGHDGMFVMWNVVCKMQLSIGDCGNLEQRLRGQCWFSIVFGLYDGIWNSKFYVCVGGGGSVLNLVYLS